MFAGVGQQFFDNNGVPLSGGKLFSYAAGTTTPVPTYTTSTGVTPHANPIILDSAGRVPSGGEIWIDTGTAYKFVLKTATDIVIGTYDNVFGSASSIYADLAAPNGSSLVGFIQSGTGAVARTVESKLRDTVSVKDFGAVGDGVADDTAAIQAAIDYAIYYSSGTLQTTSSGMKVFLPRGKYKTTDTLHLGYGVNGFTSIVFEGECEYGASASAALSSIIPTFNDRPAINVQGGRYVTIRRIAITGVNYTWLAANYNSITDRSVVANWYGPSISAANNTRYAPYCGICVDAYSGPTPANPYPNVSYPAFLGTVSQYNKNYSSATTLDEVSVQGFVVGLMVQPGDVPSASQGDFVTVRDSNLSFNVVNYGCGQSDARNPNIINTRLDNAHTAIDGRTYGAQIGQLSVNAIGCSFDRVYRALNIDLSGSPIQGPYSATLNSCYGEGLNGLGIASIASSFSGASPMGIALTECKFAFGFASAEYAPTYVLSAPDADIYLRNVVFQGAYGFYNFNGNLTVDGLTSLKPIADVFSALSGQAYKVAKSYTCGVFAPKSYRVRVNTNEYFTFFGYVLYDLTADSNNFPIELDTVSVPGAGYGCPIPWFVQNMTYGTTQYPVSNVAPLVLNRATYNLSAVSLSGNQYTFTCDNAFITDAVGANTDAPFYVGKGDIVVDSVSGQVYSVISVSFSGTGPGTTMTATMQQLNNVRWTGSAWVAGGSLSSNTGALTFYNARRVYPSPYRVNFTATAASGNFDLKICGDEANVNFMTLPVEVDDYLISSALSQSAVDSVFPKFSKVTVSNPNTGAITVNQNARRSYYGETPLFVKVL